MPTAPQQSGRSALMKNVAPCATIGLVPRAVGGLRSRICRRPGNYECFRLPRLPHSLAISLPSLSAASSRAEVQTAGHHYQWVLRSFVCPRAARACLVRGPRPSPKTQEERPKLLQFKYPGKGAATRSPLLPGGGALAFLIADPASGRCWLFYYPSLTSLLVLLRPVDKPNFNILDPQGPVPRKSLMN